MDLKTFLFSMPMKQRVLFAKRCGTSYGHLRNIAYGQKPCNETLAVNIDRESCRVVPFETLRPEVDWQYVRSTKPLRECEPAEAA